MIWTGHSVCIFLGSGTITWLRCWPPCYHDPATQDDLRVDMMSKLQQLGVLIWTVRNSMLYTFRQIMCKKWKQKFLLWTCWSWFQEMFYSCIKVSICLWINRIWRTLGIFVYTYLHESFSLICPVCLFISPFCLCLLLIIAHVYLGTFFSGFVLKLFVNIEYKTNRNFLWEKF